MARQRLTDLIIKRLKPPERGAVTIYDTVIKGFEVRCSSGGTKTFSVQYGNRKRRRRKALGQYPVLSLAEAREKALDFLHEKTVSPNKPASPRYDVALERFLRLKEAEIRRSTYREYKRLLNRHFQFETELVEDISTQQLANILFSIDAPSERTHAYTAVKTFFNWCVELGYCSVNPLANVRKPKVASSRKRVLDDAELTAIWHACGKLRKYGQIVRLLILTGQRAGQIARLHESWIDKDERVINFPESVMKNKLAHTIPFGSLFLTAITLNKPVDGWLFSPPGMPGVAFSAWSKNKAKLDSLLPQMEPWTLHDLRRTWSTNAARLDVPPHITDRVLSHVSGTLSDVALIYNKYQYLDEMRTAMLTIDRHFNQLFYQK